MHPRYAEGDSRGIATMKEAGLATTGRHRSHERNLMIEIKLIEIHYIAPRRKRELYCLSVACAY